MHAVSGYINDNTVIANENLSLYEGYDVIITILDTVKNKHSEKTTIERKKEIARELAGLWADRDDDISVEETVRMMRRRRCFDY